MIIYLSLEQVLTIHELMIKKYGGLQGIRDKNLLFSTIETPKASYGGSDLYPTIFEKASTYLYHIIRNHPFNDGNKRTAYFVALLFLDANNVVSPCRQADLEQMVVLTAAGKVSKEQLTFFLKTGKQPT